MLAVCVIIQVQINKKTQNTHYFEIVKVCTNIVHKAVIIFIESHNITFYDSTSYTTLYKVLSQLLEGPSLVPIKVVIQNYQEHIK